MTYLDLALKACNGKYTANEIIEESCPDDFNLEEYSETEFCRSQLDNGCRKCWLREVKFKSNVDDFLESANAKLNELAKKQGYLSCKDISEALGTSGGSENIGGMFNSNEEWHEHVNNIAEEVTKLVKSNPNPQNDPVNHPSHYTAGGIECIDAIAAALSPHEDPMAAWLTGQCLKYLWRWPLKNGLEDLKKTRFYLDRLIKHEEEKNA